MSARVRERVIFALWVRACVCLLLFCFGGGGVVPGGQLCAIHLLHYCCRHCLFCGAVSCVFGSAVFIVCFAVVVHVSCFIAVDVCFHLFQNCDHMCALIFLFN